LGKFKLAVIEFGSARCFVGLLRLRIIDCNGLCRADQKISSERPYRRLL